MAFRDRTETLEEHLRISVEEAGALELRLMELEGDLAARRGARRRLRLWQGIPLVTLVIVTAGVIGIVRASYAPARAAKEQGEAQRRELIDKHNQVVRQVWDLQTRLERDEARPNPSDSARRVAKLYEAIGSLNCDQERDAWLIAGAAGCSVGMRDTREAAERALSGADKQTLDGLCSGVNAP
jgi:hypothetical protein